jgi:hypothetical protein
MCTGASWSGRRVFAAQDAPRARKLGATREKSERSYRTSEFEMMKNRIVCVGLLREMDV